MSLPEVTDVQRFRLEPGDALVVHLNTDHLTAEDAATVRMRARAGLGLGEDVPILILGPGNRLSVVNAAAMSTGASPACEGRVDAGAPVPGSPANPAREVC